LKCQNEEPLNEDTIRTTSRKRTRMSDADVASARVEVNERKNMNATSTSSARKMWLHLLNQVVMLILDTKWLSFCLVSIRVHIIRAAELARHSKIGVPVSKLRR
jgi:hypothetical protein